ncbi:hypothetical protein HRW18_05560 [Streptomyces lunaelactis]|uniref:hypothetical protein n=1 Tax=Streptomyces lunaelactis TaxID=1535768 RepID=UPI0015856390|nr:hypothetical protein [Streptomyces lunaelactis]NUK07489.1 hypothetical protein [Streptomyces lunaelactis]
MTEPDTAAEAAAILRETDPRNPAEQAALDALNKRLWILWHAQDPNLGVVLLLSRAGLLRDKEREAETDKFATWSVKDTARDRAINATHINCLDNVLDIAAEELDAGKNPAEVAAWLRERRAALTAEADRARLAPH